MALVNNKIEGQSYQVEAGLTILEAARQCGYEIPSLCAFNHGECSRGSCRVCLVEATGARGLVASCVYPVNEGMEITTNSPRIMEARKMNLELLLSNHKKDCLSCVRSTTCELQALCNEYGVDEHHFGGERTVQGKSHICFVIGGSLGLSQKVWKRADEHLSFSPMTFPHQLMRVVLLEQIYRCFRIIKGEPYHK